eukprot:7380176-Prymnesium_polylepis.1
MRTAERQFFTAYLRCLAMPEDAGGVFLYARFEDVSRAESEGPRLTSDRRPVAASSDASDGVAAVVAFASSPAASVE